MITKQKTLFYFVGEQAFKSLEEAQKYDLISLLKSSLPEAAVPLAAEVAECLIKKSAEVVDILTTTPTSRLRGRKSHGATRKPRTPKAKPETT